MTLKVTGSIPRGGIRMDKQAFCLNKEGGSVSLVPSSLGVMERGSSPAGACRGALTLATVAAMGCSTLARIGEVLGPLGNVFPRLNKASLPKLESPRDVTPMVTGSISRAAPAFSPQPGNGPMLSLEDEERAPTSEQRALPSFKGATPRSFFVCEIPI